MSKTLRTFSFPTSEGTIEDLEIYSNIASEGTSFDLVITEPGWKRILTTTRSSGGHLDISVNNNTNNGPKTYQNIGFEYSGYVKYPNPAWGAEQNGSTSESINEKSAREQLYRYPDNTEPFIYQTYNNLFGEQVETHPENRVLITQARLGYAKPGAIVTENSTKTRINSICCYFEIYIDFQNNSDNKKIQLKVNYSGKFYNFGRKLSRNEEDLNPNPTITKDSIPYWNLEKEDLEYYNIPLKINHGLNIQNRINYFEENYSKNNYSTNFILQNQSLENLEKLGSNTKKQSKISYSTLWPESTSFLPEGYSNGYLFAHPISSGNYLYSQFGKGYSGNIELKNNKTFNIKSDENGIISLYLDTDKVSEEDWHDNGGNAERIITNLYLTNWNLPIYLPKPKEGYSYYLKDCQICYLDFDENGMPYETIGLMGDEKWISSRPFKAPTELGIKNGGFILYTRFNVKYNEIKNANSNQIFPMIFQAPSGLTEEEKIRILEEEDYKKFSNPPIFYSIDKNNILELKHIDYSNFAFINNNGAKNFNLPYSIIDELKHKDFNEINYYYGKALKIPTTTGKSNNPAIKYTPNAELTPIPSSTTFTYDIELNLVDILTRLYDLEQRPRIYTGEGAPGNEGRVGDIWITYGNEAASTNIEEA